MHDKFLKPYDPEATEGEIYKRWEESGYFNPDNLPGDRKEIFSIVLPPPNVTGTLHMGSALMLAIEDTLVRYNRMQGKKTLRIPGTDSAAIATQAKVEKDIQKDEGKSRHDLGREELLKRIEVFVEQNKTTMISQMRSMGSSLDWSRYAYTMDDSRYHSVMEAFLRMYKAGLIYRGDRIVNWDPKSQTTVSDDEIEYVEQKDPFYHFTYGPFDIGTVRPETKFGDKYVVMHPDDKRYAKYKHGDKIDLEWINGPITATIIKDKAADMEFGSGVMTITPSHSAIDFEIAERHNLDIERVIDDRGILLPIAGEFAGQHIKKARPLIVEKLKAKGLVSKIDEGYVHNVATNYRGGGLIEPQIKLQWFVDVSKPVLFPTGEMMSLKEWMRKIVEKGEITFLTERYQRIYYHWVDNLRDWCISRQIWFGHRIPVWYKGDETKAQMDSPGAGWEQDSDVLDTWFSAGLWTFTTLGWPDETEDLKKYHPTSLIETGYDILPFWVSRMILMSGFLLGQAPFKTIYFHGLVRDGQGRKISKSLGNNIDPVEMAKKYGMDAVRVSLIAGMAPGADSRTSEDKIRGYKNFANKLWNISRFVLENAENADMEVPLCASDAKLKEVFDEVKKEATKQIDDYRLDLAFDAIYHYAWDTFAAVILEESKNIFKASGEGDTKSRQKLLMLILTDIVKMLHPFTPFVTEEIWSHFPKKESELLLVARWPK